LELTQGIKEVGRNIKRRDMTTVFIGMRPFADDHDAIP
jgi:hypothetical protein